MNVGLAVHERLEVSDNVGVKSPVVLSEFDAVTEDIESEQE